MLPPSGLKPALIAMASIKVDFPVPFSPVMNVTLLRNSNSYNSLITGILYGYSDLSASGLSFMTFSIYITPYPPGDSTVSDSKDKYF